MQTTTLLTDDMADDSHEHVVPGSDEELATPDVRGYDFRGEFDFQEMLEAYGTTGFQATQLAEAIDIAKQMQGADATIYLTFTSNIISSSLRETVAYLVREGYVDVVITTSGSLTEDVIKTAKPFKMGEWDADEAASANRKSTDSAISTSPPTGTSGWRNISTTSSRISSRRRRSGRRPRSPGSWARRSTTRTRC